MTNSRSFPARACRCRLGMGVLATTAVLGACASPTPAGLQQLRTRAAFDLVCPHEQVQVYHLDERSKGVVGCGRRLTYVETCETERAKPACTWMLDTPTGPRTFIQHAYQPEFHYAPPAAAARRPERRHEDFGLELSPPAASPPGEPLPVPGSASPPEPKPAAPSRDFGF